MQPKAQDPLVGRMVGNYKVEDKLGEGGMGAVYKLRHTKLPNTWAALKVLHAEARGTVDMHRRFEQEALAAAAVGSHRVAKPMDIGQLEDGQPYIMMEYVAGRSLDRELAQKGPMSVVKALKIASRVADTMAVAHEKGIVHRDLKPQNIMLAQEGGKDHIVKLLDFGVALTTGDLKVVYTQETAIIGTPGYMSPEAATGGVVDGRTDVFSLGIILFVILTGEMPFASPNVTAAITNTLTATVPKLSERRPKGLDPVPDFVERIVNEALTKEAAQRPTMATLLGAISLALDRLSGKPETLNEFSWGNTLPPAVTAKSNAQLAADVYGATMAPGTPIPSGVQTGVSGMGATMAAPTPAPVSGVQTGVARSPSSVTPGPVVVEAKAEEVKAAGAAAAGGKGMMVAVVVVLVVLVGGVVGWMALKKKGAAGEKVAVPAVVVPVPVVAPAPVVPAPVVVVPPPNPVAPTATSPSPSTTTSPSPGTGKKEKRERKKGTVAPRPDGIKELE